MERVSGSVPMKVFGHSDGEIIRSELSTSLSSVGRSASNS